jgi:pyruvate/2-oxoglutarate dehydrogenase complex dihydrolipoamide dehydrogenase (E3) component
LAEYLTPDLCVIGAGSGGLAVAEAARAAGASVLVVERARIGGNALNAGLIPAQALAAAAARLDAIRDAGRFGIAVDGARVSFRRVHDHVSQVITALRPANSPAHLEAIGAELVTGTARFVDKRTLAVGETQIRAHRYVIATGAATRVPQILGLDAVPFFTAETILDNTRKLTHLLVIGGTPEALELAQSYRRLGSAVTVVTPDLPLGSTDADLSAVVLRRLGEEGVVIRAPASIVAIQPRSMGIGVMVAEGEAEDLLDVSHILVATGRAPLLDGLGLDKAGIRLDKSDPARLQLTGPLRTTNRRVFVIGDAAGGSYSKASARTQATELVRRAVLSLPAPVVAVPAVVHTSPPLAEVGLSEHLARRRLGKEFSVLRAAYGETDWARASRETYGVVKVLVDRNGRILGAGIAGTGASELVALFSLAIAQRLKVTDLAGFATASPSLAEIANRLGETAQRLDGPPGWLASWQKLVRALG